MYLEEGFWEVLNEDIFYYEIVRVLMIYGNSLHINEINEISDLVKRYFRYQHGVMKGYGKYEYLDFYTDKALFIQGGRSSDCLVLINNKYIKTY